MVDPEQCATYYSMTTGEQHLKDSGYGDILAQENNDNEDLKMGDEIKCAPWHTTRSRTYLATRSFRLAGTDNSSLWLIQVTCNCGLQVSLACCLYR